MKTATVCGNTATCVIGSIKNFIRKLSTKIFLLSEEQVNLYLTTPELRKGIRTINAANISDVLLSDRGKQENIPWWILPHIERGNYSIGT